MLIFIRFCGSILIYVQMGKYKKTNILCQNDYDIEIYGIILSIQNMNINIQFSIISMY